MFSIMNTKTYLKYAKREIFTVKFFVGAFRSIGKQKVFCVGRNKTGTTSIAKALRELGYIVGNQRLAELLIFDWARRDFRRLFLYCRTAQAFQDLPFSKEFTYQALDQKFPGSKFILTIRDTPEQWYESLTRFHATMFGQGHVPTIEDLKNAEYIYKGFLYEARLLRTDNESDDPYNKGKLIDRYLSHNNTVIEYFRHRPSDLLVLNVAEPGAYDRLCDFLGKPRTGKDFPHENKTSDIVVPSDKSPLYIPQNRGFLNKSIREKMAPAGSLRNKIIASLRSKSRESSLNEALDLINNSGFFNEQWYVSQYPEVRQIGVNPLRHYLEIGGFEGRDPGPDFSSSFYLNTYDDVKNEGINPLLHYLKYGISENRTAFPGSNTSEQQKEGK